MELFIILVVGVGIVDIGGYGVTRHDFILQVGEGAIEGTVYMKPGIPAVGSDVYLRNIERHEELLTYINTHGRYRFESLLPGTYEIGVNNKKQSVTLTDGETLIIDF